MPPDRLIECPKHNRRFHITDGSPQRNPACVALKTYKAREHDGNIFLKLSTSDLENALMIVAAGWLLECGAQ